MNATFPNIAQRISCSACKSMLEPQARFCGECGASSWTTFAESHVNQVPVQNFSKMRTSAMSTAQLAKQISRQGGASIPTFARPMQSHSPRIQKELDEHMLMLFREKIFLSFLFGLFVCINLFGFWCSMQCYMGFIGDELTKLVMASTPFLFINTLAIASLIPIKGTKREIARLEQMITSLKLQLDHSHVIH